MLTWKVEVDCDLLSRIIDNVDHQLELDTIQRVLVRDGVEGLCSGPIDLDGIPAWDMLSQPVTLTLAAPMPTGFRHVDVEVHPGRRIIIKGF